MTAASTPAPASAVTARNAAAIAASTMLARGIQFGWTIVLGALLGEAGFGVWGVVSGMVGIAAALPEFGMGMIVLRDVARERAQAGSYLRAALMAQPPLAAIAYILLILAGGTLRDGGYVQALLTIAGINLFVDLIGNIAHNQLLAAERMVTTSLILIVHIALMIAFALPVLLAGGGLPGLYMATICAGLCRAALYWIALRHADIRPARALEWRLVRHLFREGMPLAIRAFLTLTYQQIDRVMVFALLSERAAGNLTTAFVIVFGVVELTNTALLVALFPAMSRLAADRRALQAVTEQVAFMTLVTTLPIGVGISALAGSLAALLFPSFLSTSRILEILIWHAVVMMVGNAYGQQMIVQGRQRVLLAISMCGLALNIALNLVLLPAVGVTGASIAILIAQSAMLGMYLLANPAGPGRGRPLFGRALRIGGAGAIMWGAMLILRPVSPILAGVAGMLVYGGGVIVSRALTPDDWGMLRRAIEAFPVVGWRLARLWNG